MQNERVTFSDHYHAGLIAGRGVSDGLKLAGRYTVRNIGAATIKPGRKADVLALCETLWIAVDLELVDQGMLPFAAYKEIRRLAPDFRLDTYIEIPNLVRWTDGFPNLVVNEGLDDVLSVYLDGGTQDTTWFVGLLAASPSPLATWTATQIATNDFVDYTEANLQALTLGTVSGQSIDNVGTEANFSINQNTSSIGGAYVIGTNAKATPAGTLYSAGAFSGGNKAADNGDTLEVTYTATSADDGV